MHTTSYLVILMRHLYPLNTGVSWEARIINITGENSYTTVSIYGYVDWDNVNLGERVCKTGRTTGTTCGYVIAKINPYNNLLDAIITNITAASGDSGSPLYYHVMPGGRSLATYILGHLSRGENCTLAIVNGELAYLCPRTILSLLGPYAIYSELQYVML
jgi:hypothetical protein